MNTVIKRSNHHSFCRNNLQVLRGLLEEDRRLVFHCWVQTWCLHRGKFLVWCLGVSVLLLDVIQDSDIPPAVSYNPFPRDPDVILRTTRMLAGLGPRLRSASLHQCTQLWSEQTPFSTDQRTSYLLQEHNIPEAITSTGCLHNCN